MRMTIHDQPAARTLNERHGHPKIRVPLALSAGAAAIVTAALVATTGSAQAPPTSLHLVGTSQKTVGFHPNHKPRQGDSFGFGDTITGDDTGIARAVCTIIGKSQAVCTIVVQLSKGTLTTQSLIPLGGRASNRPETITGGTGAYNGARGTALVTDVSNTTVDVKITLRP
jgi:hypothetical protein